MFKSRLAIAASAVALLSIFAAPAANAAYAPPPFSGDAPTPGTVEPGGQFTVTFDAGSVNCAWKLSEFQGQSAPDGSGSTYSVTLTAPEDEGTYTVTANCTWDPEDTPNVSGPADSPTTTVVPAVYSASSVASSDSLLAVPQTDPYSIQVVVGDVASGDDTSGDASGGALPDTGGSSLTILAAGAGLVVVGAGATIAARRRKTAV